MFRRVRQRRFYRRHVAKLQLTQLVPQMVDGRQVPCLYAEMVNGGGPVYTQISRWQARFLVQTLNNALKRDPVYWGEAVRGEASATDIADKTDDGTN